MVQSPKHISENISLDVIPLDDEHTWDLICQGKTIGVFQCESKLLQDWLKKIKPRNIWELSIVIAGVRPASLESGAMDSYVNNKENPDHITRFNHPEIDNILYNTNFNIFFQEQLLKIAQRVAWVHLDLNTRLVKSDNLRKAVGKKDSAKILQIGKEFVEGCVKNGVEQSIADRLFEILKNSGRYAFNLSHSISYSFIAYYMAFMKVYFPQHFFTVALSYSDEKMDHYFELNRLAQDAKRFGYKILPPDIRQKNLEFKRVDDDKILYGLSHMKFFGKHMQENLHKFPEMKNWKDIIRFSFEGIDVGKDKKWSPDSRGIVSLILSGCFDSIEKDRWKLYYLVELLKSLTPKEVDGFVKFINDVDIIDQAPDVLIRVAEEKSVKKRKDLIRSESIILRNKLQSPTNMFWLERKEKEYCGTIMSTDILGNKSDKSTMNCISLGQTEFFETSNQILVCIIDNVITHVIKSGKNKGKTMAKINVHDSSGELSSIPVFSNAYQDCKDLLYEDNIVELVLKNYNGQWIVDSISQA